MKLSIIIVNYNVQYFLENCLRTVEVAANKLGDCEVFVVDNNSVDGSMKMVRDQFPSVIRIENKQNVGFSKANNQAIRQSKGEFILLLNPDTVVEENTFQSCYHFMKSNPKAGGLGVSMVDGRGVFLPESKRGLPTPAVAFYKIFGLSALFPKSKRFGRYHLGYLPNDEINEIDVLSGAYMWLRKETLDKIGLLDETFFMYGEDIDLSYRITLGGYKNYYFPEARIIHYKGESTKKSSINYVFVFYKAMVIFARKHFSQKNAKLFSILINLAIYLRAAIAVLFRFLKQIAFPFADAIVLLGGMFYIKTFYESNVKFVDGGAYPPEIIKYGFSFIVGAFILSIFAAGAYRKKQRIAELFKGIIFGGFFILASYALLDESLRFSRALILLSIVWALIALPSLRVLAHILGISKLKGKQQKRIAIVGSAKEIDRIKQFLKETFIDAEIITTIDAEVEGRKDPTSVFTGRLSQLKDIVQIYGINEIIFCSADLSAFNIISEMSALSNAQVEFKIAPSESLYIIGSNSIQNSGEFYILEANAASSPENKRKKRLLDIAISLILFLILPLVLLLNRLRIQVIKNIVIVLIGKASWIGYRWEDKMGIQLPIHVKGVIKPSSFEAPELFDEEKKDKLNYQYARDYSIWKDLQIFLSGFLKLGNTPS
jgi:GT2 family glycosyltransferase